MRFVPLVTTLVYAAAGVAAGQHEVVASWGWPDERPSWTWTHVKQGDTLSVNVYVVFGFLTQLCRQQN